MWWIFSSPAPAEPVPPACRREEARVPRQYRRNGIRLPLISGVLWGSLLMGPLPAQPYRQEMAGLLVYCCRLLRQSITIDLPCQDPDRNFFNKRSPGRYPAFGCVAEDPSGSPLPKAGPAEACGDMVDSEMERFGVHRREQPEINAAKVMEVAGRLALDTVCH